MCSGEIRPWCNCCAICNPMGINNNCNIAPSLHITHIDRMESNRIELFEHFHCTRSNSVLYWSADDLSNCLLHWNPMITSSNLHGPRQFHYRVIYYPTEACRSAKTGRLCKMLLHRSPIVISNTLYSHRVLPLLLLKKEAIKLVLQYTSTGIVRGY